MTYTITASVQDLAIISLISGATIATVSDFVLYFIPELDVIFNLMTLLLVKIHIPQFFIRSKELL